MIPIFIISLPHETARQQKIAARLEALGLAFSFFPATAKADMRASDRAFYNAKRRRLTMGKDLYDGEIACMHSHKSVYKKMLAMQLPYALVLEDDCMLCDEFPQIIEALLACHQKWDLVRFFGDPKHERRTYRKLHQLLGEFWLARSNTMPGEAHCYLIDRKAALKLTAVLRHAAAPIDILMGQPWKTGLGVFTVTGKVAWQDKDFSSAIGEERFSGKLHVQGLEKILFHILAPLAHMRRNLCKRLWYYGSLPYDWLTKQNNRCH